MDPYSQELKASLHDTIRLNKQVEELNIKNELINAKLDASVTFAKIMVTFSFFSLLGLICLSKR
jgi:hypothetical protein